MLKSNYNKVTLIITNESYCFYYNIPDLEIAKLCDWDVDDRLDFLVI